MIVSHKITLDLTVEQTIALAKACGCARFTWNWALTEWIRQYQAGEKPTALKLKKQWNAIKEKDFPWIYDSPKDANQQPFANLGKAFNRFFKQKKGYPKFKKRGVHDSFYLSNDKFSVADKTVHLPVIGKLRLREALRFDGKIIAGNVSRKADKWFIAIQVDTNLKLLPETTKSLGVDLGVKTAVVCSDGQSFASPMPLKANLKRLRRLSKQHSRKQKGSQNRQKSKQRLARLHARIANIRNDWTHKLTSKLIHENQVICIEDLNVRGMLANHKLSRAINDVGFFELRRQLEYKAKAYGRTLKIVSRWFPSSKQCSGCGYIKESLSLGVRTYLCDSCGLSIDRDLNAALNVCTAGLAGNNACGPKGSGWDTKVSTKLCRVEAGTKSRVRSRALTN